jgi:hypothetical protein
MTPTPPAIEVMPVLSRDLGAQLPDRRIRHDQHIYRFNNGYGASVVMGDYTYGGPNGNWELAVIRFYGSGADDWHLEYETPITSDVLGHLSTEDVARTLIQIAALPAVTP